MNERVEWIEFAFNLYKLDQALRAKDRDAIADWKQAILGLFHPSPDDDDSLMGELAELALLVGDTGPPENGKST